MQALIQGKGEVIRIKNLQDRSNSRQFGITVIVITILTIDKKLLLSYFELSL